MFGVLQVIVYAARSPRRLLLDRSVPRRHRVRAGLMGPRAGVAFTESLPPGPSRPAWSVLATR